MKKEYLLAGLLAFFVLILVNAPILYFYLFGKEDLVFLGRRFINGQDTYTYVSFIEQAKQGRTLFENLYTSENQTPLLFRPSYLLIGTFAHLFNISSIAAYHIARVFLSFIFFVMLYHFIGKVFFKRKHRLLAYFLVLTSSGLGFLLSPLIPVSSDLLIPDSNTFFSLEEAPHFILSQILMLSSFLFLINFLQQGKKMFLFLCAFLLFFLSFEHPFNLFVTGPTVVLLCITSGISRFKSMLIGIVCSVGIFVQFYLTETNPILQVWQSQNLLYSPSPFSYIVGFGLLIPLAIIGAENVLRDKDKTLVNKLILFWAALSIILLYAPVTFQRRLGEGLHIPIALLATSGLITILAKIKGKYVKGVLISILVILIISPVYIQIRDFDQMGSDTKDDYYFFLSSTEYHALDWVKQHTTVHDVILSNWFFGNLIPGVTGRKVYIGHKIQTIDFDRKIEGINTFLLNTDTTAATKYLSENHITYIFLGKKDSMLQYGFQPETLPFLQNVYQKNGVSIYKVIPLRKGESVYGQE